MKPLSDRLLSKSIEAFTMAIEIYNKPTIKYRVEGFSVFICNAWELMLKAHMIKKTGERSIYHKDNQNRTLTLENCVKTIFTNDKDPLRLNIEKIIELRNTSTHFITQEYEMLYVPLFQACVLNFNEKIMKFHEVDMTDIIPQNFLTLAVSMKALDASEIIAKYPEEIANKLVQSISNLNDLSSVNNSSFAIRIDHYHYLTKDKDKATSFVNIDNTSDTNVKVIKDVKDPNNTHKHTTKSCIEAINKCLKKLGIPWTLNKYHFNLFCRYYSIKDDQKLCYAYKITSTPQYSYSQQTIEFIINEIKNDPENIIQNLKASVSKK